MKKLLLLSLVTCLFSASAFARSPVVRPADRCYDRIMNGTTQVFRWRQVENKATNMSVTLDDMYRALETHLGNSSWYTKDEEELMAAVYDAQMRASELASAVRRSPNRAARTKAQVKVLQNAVATVSVAAFWVEVPVQVGRYMPSVNNNMTRIVELYKMRSRGLEWDQNGNTKWAPRNARRLCGNTTRANQPIACFRSLIPGCKVSKGRRRGCTWQWQDAVNLCQGTHNARRTINCFTRKVANGRDWKRAIRRCTTRDDDLDPRPRPRRPRPPRDRDRY